MRKNVLVTDLPPGIDEDFLREQQELAMGDSFKQSPARSQGVGSGSWEKRRFFGTGDPTDPVMPAFAFAPHPLSPKPCICAPALL